MNDFNLCAAAVLVLTLLSACNIQQEGTLGVSARNQALVSVVNTVTIDGEADAVFDLVTTARFWPRWHPATTHVSGVVERPYRLGDRIWERGRVGTGEFQVTWRVAEHVQPQRIVLQAEGLPARIAYSFHPRGKATEFTRELKYNVEDLKAVASDPREVHRLMQAQSEQAVNQLKALVEKILRDELVGVK